MVCDLSCGGSNSCNDEGTCADTRPNILVVLDYSTSMNLEFNPGGPTRFAAITEALTQHIFATDSYVATHANVALTRFGHDPLPNEEGTTLDSDISDPPIIDGVALDVDWYDREAASAYYGCGEAEQPELLINQPPPINGSQSGIGTYTQGALQYGLDLIAESRSDHNEEPWDRPYVIFLVTDGRWTGADGIDSQSPEYNPTLVVETMPGLYVQLHVLTLNAEEELEVESSEWATSTQGSAWHVDTAQGYLDIALLEFADAIGSVIPESCGGTL